MKLLHLDSSALAEQSVSRQLTAAIVAEQRRRHPGLEVEYLDLAADPLPHWTPGEAADPGSAQLLAQFLGADMLVIGAPMYNFGIPSTLKAWIDRIAVAGKTFRYTADGPQGLAGGKRVLVASTRGGLYSQGAAAAMDHQESYLRSVFGFLGIDDLQFIRAEGLATGAVGRQRALQAAQASIVGELPLAA